MSEYAEIDLHKEFSIIQNTSVRRIGDGYLIIGYEKGVVTTFSMEEKQAYEYLVRLKTPSKAIVAMCKHNSSADVVGCMTRLLHKLVNAGFTSLHHGRHIEQSVDPRRYLRLHLTNACQLTCAHCYANSSPRSKRENELVTEEWNEVITSAAKSGCDSVLFTGGEALLRDDCIALLSLSKSLGLTVRLFSNGLLIKKHINEIAKYCDAVQISIDGVNEETNSLIRGKRVFNKAVEAVNLLLVNKVETTICMTITDMTWGNIKSGFDEFLKLFPANSNHLKYKVCFLNNYGRATSLNKLIETESMTSFYEKYSHVLRESDELVSCKTRSCGYCEQLVISPFGHVFPCHYLEESLGNYFDHSANHWYQVLGDNYNDNTVDSVSTCNECDLKYFCGGTCRFMNKNNMGSKYISYCSEQERETKYSQLFRAYSKSGWMR